MRTMSVNRQNHAEARAYYVTLLFVGIKIPTTEQKIMLLLSRCRLSQQLASILSSLVPKLMVESTGKSSCCKNFCQILISCQSFTCFQQDCAPAYGAYKTVDH